MNRRDTAEASLFRWRGCVAGWKWILTFILRVPSYVAVLCMYSVLALLVPSVSQVHGKNEREKGDSYVFTIILFSQVQKSMCILLFFGRKPSLSFCIYRSCKYIFALVKKNYSECVVHLELFIFFPFGLFLVLIVRLREKRCEIVVWLPYTYELMCLFNLDLAVKISGLVSNFFLITIHTYLCNTF